MQDIKISGKWTITGTNFIEFSGDLYLDPKNNIIQLVAYTDKPIGMYKEFDIITGESLNGSKATLYKCFVSTESIIIGEKREYNTTIRADYCFSGIHFRSADEVVFHEITTRFSYLDEWAFFKVFDFKPVKGFDYSLKYKRPREIEYKVSNETVISIFSSLDTSYGSIVDKENKIIQKVYISVRHKKPKTLEESINVIQALMDFISFCTSEKISYIEIIGYNPNHFDEYVAKDIEKMKNKLYHSIPIYIIGQIDEDYPKSDPLNFLLNLHDLGDNIKTYLDNWFKKIVLLRPVVDLYLNTLGNYHLSTELYFLNLVQALESYHRRRKKNFVLEEAEHKKRVKSIMEAFPEHKVWLNDKLYRANEPNLKDRIDELTHENDDYWIFFSGNNERKKFLTDVKITRNYLTHYDESLKDKALSGEELNLACIHLKNIIEFHLLKEIGFSYEFIRPKIIKRLGHIKEIFDIINFHRGKQIQ